MTSSKDFFKLIHNTAKETNTHEEKILKYFFNKKDIYLNPHSDNVYPPINKYLLPEQQNEINDYGYRSDNFIKEHNGKHILFSGCSNTFGFGLNQDETWSKMLYDKISKNIKCSGYFNLAFSGGGIQMIISNLFRYFKHFGNPDYIFLNLPEHKRFMGYIPESKSYTKITIKPVDIALEQIFCIINYQYYLMLEQYCSSNNIKLYSTSWIVGNDLTNENPDFFSSFKTFYFVDPKKMFDDVVKDEKKYNLDYYYYARDDDHKGVGYHIWLANFVYDIYKKDNGENS